MAVPQSKAELLSAIQTNYAKLAKDLASIPEPLTRAKTLEGHMKNTTMSVHDLVAYLVGWNELVLKWHAQQRAGKVVDFPETGFQWNQLGQLAQKFYADYNGLAWPALLTRFEAAKTKLVTLVESQSDIALYGVSWHEKHTMGRMIQFNTAAPYANARVRLRAWKKANDLD